MISGFTAKIGLARILGFQKYKLQWLAVFVGFQKYRLCRLAKRLGFTAHVGWLVLLD